MTEQGLVQSTTRRGAHTTGYWMQWIRMLFGELANQIKLSDVAIVCDNASCHSNLELVTAEEPYTGYTLLRRALYSSMLDPIEGI